MKLNLKHALVGAMLVTATSNAHATDTIKVFFLAGQSNMAGNGMVEAEASPGVQKPGTLRDYVNTNPTDYGHLVDTNGDWTTRSDVWVWNRVGNASGTITDTWTGDLGVNFGANIGAATDRFGPEVGIGKVLGDHYDEQVVLVKTAWGGKSLYEDFRPPSAGGTTGAHYTLMVNAMQEALGDIATRYSGQTIEIEGLLWHQGWNDRGSEDAVAEYEDNLNHLIADLRGQAFIPSDIKVVIGTTGMGSDETFDPDNREPAHFLQKPKTRAQDLVAAQMAVGAADTNAATVDTHPFWRDDTLSPNDEIEHWNRNGETYYLIGESMGEAMVTLVPEPSSLGLLALGGLMLIRRRRG